MLRELESTFTSVPERYFIELGLLNDLFVDGEHVSSDIKEWFILQHDLPGPDDEPAMTLTESERYFTAIKKLHDQILGEDCTIKETLKWLDEEHDIKTVYYAGSGHDRIPKETLGKNRIVHLSLEENQGYFETLGDGIKVKGDYRRSPFKNKSFDVTLVRGVALSSMTEALWEFRRVTKDAGLIIINDNYGNKGHFDVLCDYLESDFPKSPLNHSLKRIELPQRYAAPNIAVFQNKPAPRGLA